MPNSCFLESERFSVAPMVDVTDSIFRRMVRLLSKRCMLYTEMIAADALVHEKYYLINFKDEELPCTLQLGSSEPKKLYLASKVGAEHGYSALNLNAGCPSDKVQSGSFGAMLMKTPKLIGECFQAMQEGALAANRSEHIPVSVKTRIGVDDLDSLDFTMELMGAIYDAGCRHIIIHARKAWLNGLSPKENRTIPPLDYERVYAVKQAFPDLKVTINGGLLTLADCQRELTKVDGVMLGRAIIDNPYLLCSVDQEIFNNYPSASCMKKDTCSLHTSSQQANNTYEVAGATCNDNNQTIIDTQSKYISGSSSQQEFQDEPNKNNSLNSASSQNILTREEVVELMVKLGEEVIKEGRSVRLLYRHLLGLYNGCPNSRLYRRYLSENMNGKDIPASILIHAVKAMQK